MRVRKSPGKFVIATGIVILSACGDVATAPSNDGPPSSVAGSHVVSDMLGDTAVTYITLNTDRDDEWVLPEHSRIRFPAHSVCDIETTSYGPTEWDKPCRSERGSVTITVKSWIDENDRPRVDFSPSMRFNPRVEPVVLELRDRRKAQEGLAILYCPTLTDDCVDESLTDPSLRTARQGRQYVRRLKHFSGYNIASGRSYEK